MDNGIWGIVIAGLFSLAVAFIHRGFKRTERDHGLIARALDRIEQKIDRHIENHDER